MKTRTLILALIASLLNMTAIFASDRVVSIKSEKLNEMQIATLEYAQKILKERNNELILPLELFSIVGDTTQKDCPDAIPQWDNAYFKEDADWKCNLMIPLKAKTSLGVVNSTLCVRTNNKEQFQRIVVTSLPTKEYLIKNKTINNR